MPTALELRERRGEVLARAQEIHELAEEADRDFTAQENLDWNKAHTDAEELRKRIERAEQAERTPASSDGRSLRTVETATANHDVPLRSRPEYQKAFKRWLTLQALETEDRSILSGSAVALTAEQRALSVGSSPAGGYLVPDDFVNRIEKAEAWFGGMRQVATVISTESGNDLQYPTNNDTGNVGAIIGENTQISEQDTTFGLRVLKAFMYTSKLIRVPYTLLQDAAVDIEGYLAAILAERIGRITNTHFTTGVGPNQPSGIVNDAAAGVTAAATGAITADEVIDLVHSLNIAYRNGRPRFMFHDLTLRELRQLKDGTGNYLWRPGISAGEPDTLYGYPYTVNNDMPQMATTTRAILFGQLSKYIIRDVRGIQMVRLEERYADFLQVGFFAFSRHDGMLLDAGGNPVVALAMA